MPTKWISSSGARCGRNRGRKEAQDIRQQQVFEAAGCTFQPNITRPQVRKRGPAMSYTQQDFDQQLAQDNHQKGLDRYLQRMDKAKDIKEQKAKLEDHLYNREKKWTPKLTQPVEPKLTAFINGRKDVNVKSLNKPVDIMGQSENAGKFGKTWAEERKSNGVRGSQTRTQDFIKMTQKSKSQFVEIKPDMTFEDAVVMIHQHILSLDL
ncbi:hypothetical protein FGO68_gene1324 [Halteria grandinella]|uniref:Uncharacterized protein n=1 Tax=Halteria grandinella TaxID=5974 RepID=A0A8J8NFC9_HALGN|nr:hypothetical protein FGO68_gene1324 [Halteria grandinella]